MSTLIYFGQNIVYSSKNTLVVHKNEKFETVSLPVPQEIEHKNKVSNESNSTIVSLCISPNQERIAVSTENKQVVVFNNSMEVLKNFNSNRIPSKLCFTSDNKSLIVADKTGDVFLYNLTCEEVQPLLILGHLSVILDVTITDCGKFIITCDRDEKIRVSNFPNAYNIECFCLGHDEFVISLNVFKDKLISASGDGTIKFWNYLNGTELFSINTNEYIDEEVINKFRAKMSADCVDVSALPITDMQIIELHNYICIAVSLFKYNKILIFSVNPDSLQLIQCEQVEFDSSFSFLLRKELFVLTSSNIIIFEFEDKSVCKKSAINLSLSHDSSLSFTNDQNISLLYKKKFDNVGDYLERKKARMELK